MPETRLEQEKDELISRLTEAYAQDAIDMQGFELAVTRVSAAADEAALSAERASLDLSLPVLVHAEASPPAHRQAEVQSLDCVSANLRRVGDWVKAGRYSMRLQSSNARLDFTAYEGSTGLRLVIELEARSSNLRLIVPAGFEVEDALSERISSTVRNRPRDAPYGGNRIVLTGRLQSSTVKVKYRR